MKKIIAVLAVCLLGFAAFVELRAQTQDFPTLTSAQYASMNKDDVYVIMFTLAKCPPCAMAKIKFFPGLVKKYAGESNVHVYLFPVDADTPAPDGTTLNARLGINQAPTFVVLYNDTSMFSHTGFPRNEASQNELEKEIASAVGRVK